MLRAALRNILAHKLRLGLTVLTVALGIAFVAGTNIFTDSLKASFDALVAQPRPDVTVTPRTELDDPTEGGTAISADALTLPESLVGQIAELPEVDEAFGRVVTDGAFVLDRSGAPIGPDGPPARVASWIENEDASVLTLFAGSYPTGPNEVALLQSTAEAGEYQIGDEVSITTRRAGVVSPTLVGLVNRTLSGGLGGTLAVFDLETAQSLYLAPGEVNLIGVMARTGVSQTELAQAVQAVVPELTTLRTADEAADQTSERIEEGFTFLNTFLLAFGFLALFVATFLIFNTFAMLVAQRTRELALLRAIGATRRQVFTSVLFEAAFIGALASIIGLLGGIGLAIGLRALIDRLTSGLPAGPLVVEPRTIALAAGVGIAVTVLASFFPARRASFIPPIAAMRIDTPLPERSLRLLTILGVTLIIAAVPAAIQALNEAADDGQMAATWLGVSALLAILGVLALTPALAKPILGFMGAPIRRTAVGNLAVENARRNPRRTSATTSALAVGLALMTAVTVIGTSARASVNDVVDRTIGADFVILGRGFQPLETDVFAAVADTPNTRVVTYLRNVPADIDGERILVTGVEAGVIDDVVDVQMTMGSLDDIALGSAVIDDTAAAALGVTVGDVVQADLVNGQTEIRIVGTYQPIGFLQGLIVTMPTLMSYGALERDTAIYVRGAPGVDLDEVRTSVQARLEGFPAAQLQDQADIKREINQQFDVLFGFVYALLALSILVAFLGIVNTLSLSVYERFREIGLLRAVGTTRQQIRRMITLEALLIALLGTMTGISIGLIFGTLFQRILEPQGIAILQIPVPTLVIFVVFGTLGGLLASLWPAWRASRLSILNAIATD